MSTPEEFEDAPLGATATHPDGRRAVGTFDYVEGRWYATDYGWYTDSEMAKQGYVLDPLPDPTPGTASEALDLAWILGCPVKEGQVIPEGAKWMKKVAGDVREYTMKRDHTVTITDTYILRTLYPLPDPEPDWLDAPAVLAIAEGFSYRRTWVPVGDDYWASVGDGRTHWSELTDVTPLYPKGTDNDR